MINGLNFALREGAGGIRRGAFHSFVVAASTALTVAVLGFFYYGGINLQHAAESLLQSLQFEAFIAPSVPDSLHQELMARVQGLDPRWKITYISRADAAARFAKEFDPQLFDVLKENPLPASFRIILPPQTLTPEAARGIAQKLREVDGIDEVVYDQELMALFQSSRQKLASWGMIAGSLAVLLALGLTYNSVRLKIDHQREAVHLMSLMGATPMTLRGLYWVQGAALGLSGGIFGAILLSFLVVLIRGRLTPGVELIGPSFMVCALAGGVLGLCGGVLAVGKYLKF